MRQSRWCIRWRNKDHEEKNEGCHEEHRSTGTRGLRPELWRRGSSNGRRGELHGIFGEARDGSAVAWPFLTGIRASFHAEQERR